MLVNEKKNPYLFQTNRKILTAAAVFDALQQAIEEMFYAAAILFY